MVQPNQASSAYLGNAPNRSRIEAAEAHLNSAHNKGGHDMVWNKQFGKDKKKVELFSEINGKCCNREWAWMLENQRCRQTELKHGRSGAADPPRVTHAGGETVRDLTR